MLELLSRGWRVLATGLGFVVFGSAALLLRVLAFPLLRLLVRQGERRVALVRAAIRLTLRGFIALLQALGVLRYELSGLEKLERGGLLILANHPTLLDTVFLMAFVKRADCIAKAALWHNPFTAGPVRAAGYINNAGGPELIADCIASLRRGNNLIVFPEGTRTPAGGLVRFKRGAANIAVRGGRDVTPVLISCQPSMLGKGEAWWRVPLRRARFTIEVREDLAVGGFAPDGVSEALAARRLNDFLQQYFTGKQEHHA
ncbi:MULTISPECIES: lysophospholipid acyltransferase family protein [unclassified Janthinobacterium]|uniref:lysophospholipid acyltransferase family protein n=1 Tax=unclassified Janthinobacterium TaxID=2610881 RepID=UPI0003495B3E|nr:MULTISPECIES: lysophospholipid acyltransferase family protein [unclassified Janthinobacterium]MEC5163263.1 1-acyl-sn-glycerol-3-phosphate acyltransferase [Janthinobacterium sp. CG_S6]